MEDWDGLRAHESEQCEAAVTHCAIVEIYACTNVFCGEVAAVRFREVPEGRNYTMDLHPLSIADALEAVARRLRVFYVPNAQN